MKVSDYIVSFLKSKGIEHVFGYPGGMVIHIMNSLDIAEGIEMHVCYHEQAAAFAAEGYARVTGKVGVALATSGPGATNLLTGIGSAYFDSIACMYITGQVNTYESKGEQAVRQIGFQELDIVAIATPITKYAKYVGDASQIKYELQKAFHIAKSGRPGPVLLDLPMNIQRAELEIDELLNFSPVDSKADCKTSDVEYVINVMKQAERPVIVAGGGIRTSNAATELVSFAEKMAVPVVSSLMGLDVLPTEHPLSCGLIGAYGNRYGNFTLANSDLILVLGSRMDTRQTGTNMKSFAREAKIIRVDIDKGELAKELKAGEYAIYADVLSFLTKGLALLTNTQAGHEFWLDTCKKYREVLGRDDDLESPNGFVNAIAQLLPSGAVITADVGQNQMWVAQSLTLKQNQRLLMCGGMGSMGFSLPAAIGASYAAKMPVIAITGDGGLQMNIQELQYLFRENRNVKIIVFNNNALGMIRHFQEMYFDERYTGTIPQGGYSAPDFCKIAEAYGIAFHKITKANELEEIKALIETSSPALIEIVITEKTYVFPKLAINRPIEDQEPLMDRELFNANMLIKPYEI